MSVQTTELERDLLFVCLGALIIKPGLLPAPFWQLRQALFRVRQVALNHNGSLFAYVYRIASK
jgi:hypothetical protein